MRYSSVWETVKKKNLTRKHGTVLCHGSTHLETDLNHLICLNLKKRKKKEKKEKRIKLLTRSKEFLLFRRIIINFAKISTITKFNFFSDEQLYASFTQRKKKKKIIWKFNIWFLSVNTFSFHTINFFETHAVWKSITTEAYSLTS